MQKSLFDEENNIFTPSGVIRVSNNLIRGKEVKRHIVNKEEILIGRNDEEGYYFKFGIYRVGNSTIPVLYNLAGYEEHEKSSGK